MLILLNCVVEHPEAGPSEPEPITLNLRRDRRQAMSRSRRDRGRVPLAGRRLDGRAAGGGSSPPERPFLSRSPACWRDMAGQKTEAIRGNPCHRGGTLLHTYQSVVPMGAADPGTV